MSEQRSPLDTLTTQELLRTESGLHVVVSKYLDADDRDPIWNMIQQGFVDLNRRSYEKQDMTRDEYIADVESPNVLNYTARDQLNQVVGYFTVHVGLEHITWADTQPQREMQNIVDKSATPYYIGTLVVPASVRGTETATRLLQGALLHFKEVNRETGQDSLCFFDCADANYPWLALFAEKATRPDDEFEGIGAAITEIHTEYWVRDKEDTDIITKIGMAPAQEEQDMVLDKQHYYAIKIETTP